jgi:hypothetical protein
LRPRPHPIRRRAPPRPNRRIRCTSEIEKVGTFGLIQLERANKSFKDTLGHPAKVSPFKTDVIVNTDPCKKRDLLTPQPRHTAPAAIIWEASLGRSDLRTPRRQKLSHLGLVIHVSTVRQQNDETRGSISTPYASAPRAQTAAPIPLPHPIPRQTTQTRPGQARQRSATVPQALRTSAPLIGV